MIDHWTDPLSSARRRDRKADVVTLLTCYLFCLMAIPSRLVFAPLGGAGAPSTILGAVFFVWYLLNWFHPSSKLDTERQPIRRAAIVFLCVVLASYVSATQHLLPVLELNGADRGIIRVLGWTGILLLTADGIYSVERLRILLRRIVLGATAMAMLGVVQFFTGLNFAKYIVIPGLSAQQAYTDILLRDSLRRPSATAVHPIEFGFVLAMVLPFAIHQARYAPRGVRAWRWLQVALIAVTLPMTVSRSALLGLAAGLVVILPTWPRRDRWFAYLAVFFGLLALYAVIPGLVRTIRNLFLQVGSDASSASRTAAFGHAAPLLSMHPWLGQGLGTFLPSTMFFTDDQYLNTLIEIGVVGLVALLGLFVTGWSLARSTRRKSGDPEVRDLAQCMAASVAVAVVGYATFDALYFPMAAGLTFLLLGCVGAAWRLLRRDDPSLA